MPDFTRGISSSFEIGAKAGGGGRFTGLINYLNAIADQRNEKVQTAKALDLLGKTEGIKSQAKIRTDYGPEALEFEKAKKSIDYDDIPPGFVTVGGKVYKDPSFKRQETPEEMASNLNNEISKNELVAMAKALPRLDQADQAINQLEELYYKGAKPDKNPLMSRITGIPDAIVAKAGFNPELNTYMNNAAGFSGLIAKGGFGEAGMLTQQDIERIKKLLPSSNSTPTEASLAFTEIKTILSSARKRFEEKKSQYTGGKSYSQELNNTQPPSDIITIQDITGREIQIPRQEAIKKGYIDG